MKKVIVSGGGFKGIVASYMLKKKGFDVTLVEGAPFLGGVMRSQEWKNYIVDNGVHLFDSISKDCAELITEIMDGDVHSVGFNYASFFDGKTTDDLAIPDYTSLDKETQQKILFEMVENLAKPIPEKYSSLYHRFSHNYGETAAKIIDKSFKYIYLISSKEIEVSAMNQTTFHRLKFLPDDVALELKKHPRLDDYIAAKRISLKKIDTDFISIYPGTRGMLGFCEKAEEKLEEAGVNIIKSAVIDKLELSQNSVAVKLGDKFIEADHIFWAGSVAGLANAWKQDSRLSSMLHKTPMVLFAFETNSKNINDYTYFHQFSDNLITFRPTSSGLMGKQVSEEGNTFIVAECPTGIGSELWEDPEAYANQSWEEIKKMGLVTADCGGFVDMHFFKAKQTYCMPKVGSEDLCDEIEREIKNTNGVVILPKRSAFLRREIFWAVEDSIKELES